LKIFASKVYVLKANGSTLQHIINIIYSFKMKINSSIINEHKHITQQMIKEFTPLLGYISWSSFQWIIIIIFSKCSKTCFTMLKMTNRLLQWLQSIQKPLAGLFWHLVWPKDEEVRLPGSPLFKLVVSASTNCTLVHST
jgi:hypothetical protein